MTKEVLITFPLRNGSCVFYIDGTFTLPDNNAHSFWKIEENEFYFRHDEEKDWKTTRYEEDQKIAHQVMVEVLLHKILK